MVQNLAEGITSAGGVVGRQFHHPSGHPSGGASNCTARHALMVRAECCAVAEQRAHLNDFSFGIDRLLKNSTTTAITSAAAMISGPISVNG
jgi:hypothetical protein